MKKTLEDWQKFPRIFISQFNAGFFYFSFKSHKNNTMKKIQVTLRTTVEYRIIIIIMEENKDQFAGIGKFISSFQFSL